MKEGPAGSTWLRYRRDDDPSAAPRPYAGAVSQRLPGCAGRDTRSGPHVWAPGSPTRAALPRTAGSGLQEDAQVIDCVWAVHDAAEVAGGGYVGCGRGARQQGMP